jgi:hypothetical protein
MCEAGPHRRLEASQADGALMEMAISGYTLSLDGRRVCLVVLRDTQQMAAERA